MEERYFKNALYHYSTVLNKSLVESARSNEHTICKG
jgi:hypothetical protein